MPRAIGARRKYQQFIEEGMSAESIWKDLKGQIYLGDDDLAYGYQQIAKEFGVHFTTVGRIVRQPMKRVSATRVTR